MKNCVKCGAMFSGRHCLACAAVSTKRYREANLLKIKKLVAAWHAEHADKMRAYRKKWELAHPEHALLRKRKWEAENPDKKKTQWNRWRTRHSEQYKVRKAKYRAAHPDLDRIYKQNRIARLRQNGGGALSPGLVERLFKLQKGRCACCGHPLGYKYHIDHIMPLSLGGVNEDRNIQLLKNTCNHEKWAKHPIDFMRSRGFLL